LLTSFLSFNPFLCVSIDFAFYGINYKLYLNVSKLYFNYVIINRKYIDFIQTLFFADSYQEVRLRIKIVKVF